MPPIGHLNDFQQGTFWGEYAEVLLFGIYTCLVIITLWVGLRKGRLHLIGWCIVAVYWLTICRVGLGLYITYRVMFINGGNHAIYQTTDCVLHGIRQGCTMVAAHLADSLFIWRLYVIWSRNIRILVLPAFLFICSATGATVVTITDFLLGNGQPYVAINSIAFDFILAVVIANTCYVTILLAGRLWWVGRMTDKMESPGQIRKSRYQGAIIALVQSGFMYTVAVTLSLIFEVKQNIAMGIVMGNVTAAVVGISATLLVLQLNIFQDGMKRQKHNGPLLTTGATIHFARHQSTHTSTDSEAGGTSLSLSLTRRRRRASIAAYYLRPHYHDSDRDASCLPSSNQSPPPIPCTDRSSPSQALHSLYPLSREAAYPID